MAKQILILALFGDPTLPAGIPNTGGFNQTLRELLTAISAFHFPICVITDTSIFRENVCEKISDNIELIRVAITPEEHNEQERLRVSQGRVLEEVYHVLSDRIDDIALMHSFYWFSGHIASLIHAQRKIPFIHTPISLSYNKIAANYQPNCLFQVDCEPTFLRAADRVLAITEQEANILVSHYQVEKSRVIVTGRTVDAVFHHPARDYSGQPRETIFSPAQVHSKGEAHWWSAGAYTYLGRMVPIKGVLEIARAWKTLRRKYGTKTPPLWLVGGTPAQITKMRSEIIRQIGSIDAYEMTHEIVWWGYLDQPSISTLFLKTLVLVTHSRFEPGGRMVLEAMCQGRPVIATPNGFAADYIRDWENGFLVPYGDCAKLAQRMEHFIAQPYLACTMGAAAKLRFNQMEHRWNYLGIHKDIYTSYLTSGTPTVSSSATQLFGERDHNSKHYDEVDSFPYYNVRQPEDKLRGELEALLHMKIDRINTVGCPGSHALHYAIQAGNRQFRLKQFYCRLNQDAVWDQSANQKVMWSTEQFQAAVQTQSFCRVVPTIAMCESQTYYITSQFQTMLPNYADLCQMLAEFSKPPECYRQLNKCTYSPVKTLETAIDTLERSTRALNLASSEKLLALPAKARDLVRQSSDDIQFGINYGKELHGHIVCVDGKVALLPCSSWYWGELGPDQISAARLFCQKPQPLPGQKGPTRILLWQLIMAWKDYLESAWRDPSTAERSIQHVCSALDMLQIKL